MNMVTTVFRCSLVAVCSMAVLLPLVSPTTSLSWAAWPGVDANLPVCELSGEQWSPLIASDGSDGCVLSWWDTRNGWEQINIYAQRVSAEGDILWAPAGAQLTSAPSYTYVSYMVMCADDAGGAFIAWEDPREGNFDVYVQHVNGTGTAVWQENGVQLSKGTYDDYVMDIAADGRGGCIVAWNTAGSNQRIAAQRLNETGTKLWSMWGVEVSTGTDLSSRARIVSDGSGGMVACWLDGRYHPGWNEFKDIYSQRLDSLGTLCWADTGVAVLTRGSAPFYAFPELVSNGSGRFFIAWYDWRSSGFDIYAQCLSQSGQVLWTPDGATVCQKPYDQTSPRIVPDEAGGLFCAWRDNYTSIYVQRLTANGSQFWQPAGVLAAGSSEEIVLGSLVRTSNGLCALVYSETLPASSAQLVKAQTLDGYGNIMWGAEAEALSTVVSSKSDITAVADTHSGIIAAWQDERNASTAPDIYAQKVVIVPAAEVTFSGSPTMIHRGGVGVWSYELTNNTDTTVVFDWWLTAAGPMSRDRYLGQKTLLPHATETGTLRLRVPDRAPLGPYTICGYVGAWSTRTSWDTDCFSCEVVGSARYPER